MNSKERLDKVLLILKELYPSIYHVILKRQDELNKFFDTHNESQNMIFLSAVMLLLLNKGERQAVIDKLKNEK